MVRPPNAGSARLLQRSNDGDEYLEVGPDAGKFFPGGSGAQVTRGPPTLQRSGLAWQVKSEARTSCMNRARVAGLRDLAALESRHL